jgi:hypothetical protein
LGLTISSSVSRLPLQRGVFVLAFLKYLMQLRDFQDFLHFLGQTDNPHFPAALNNAHDGGEMQGIPSYLGSLNPLILGQLVSWFRIAEAA